MKKITATELRGDLFNILGKVKNGESMSVILNGFEVAMIVPTRRKNWRSGMKGKSKLLVPADEAFKPIDDIWKDYQ